MKPLREERLLHTCGACGHAHATEHRGRCGAFMGVNAKGPVFCRCPRLEPIR